MIENFIHISIVTAAMPVGARRKLPELHPQNQPSNLAAITAENGIREIL
jgi:hypothetical protein